MSLGSCRQWQGLRGDSHARTDDAQLVKGIEDGRRHMRFAHVDVDALAKRQRLAVVATLRHVWGANTESAGSVHPV